MTGVERAIRYAGDAADGRIVTGVKVRKAAERFLRQIDRARDASCPYAFDEERADRPIRYMERFLTPSKGDYEGMRLMPWQCFCEAATYGFVDRETGRRTVRESMILVGKGNGKSTLLSGNAAYAASKDGERGADVYVLSNTLKQSRIVYNETSAMIRSSPQLDGHFRVRRDAIFYDATASQIVCLPNTPHALDGLNPHVCIFDEFHEFKNFELINTVNSAQLKRRQPLRFYISTMGEVLDGALMQMYRLYADMLNGDVDEAVAQSMFGFIAELDEEDDIEDSANWVKANPSLGYTLQLSDLEAYWQRARLVPQERSGFINKQLNIFTNAADASYVDADVVDRNNGSIDERTLEGAPCFGGFDLSTSEDFTAAALVFPLDDGRLFVKQHTWLPQKKAVTGWEKIPYYEWQMAGHLTIVDSDYVPKEAVYDWFREMDLRYDIRSIGYDPANAPWLVRMLEEEGGFRTSVVRQGALTLNGPMKDVKEKLLDGRVVFNNDPLFRWYLHNVKLRREASDADNGNWVPTKRQRFRKIDGFMAFLDAYVEYMRLQPVQEELDGDAVTVLRFDL